MLQKVIKADINKSEVAIAYSKPTLSHTRVSPCLQRRRKSNDYSKHIVAARLKMLSYDIRCKNWQACYADLLIVRLNFSIHRSSSSGTQNDAGRYLDS